MTGGVKYRVFILLLIVYGVLTAEVIKVGAYENAPKIFTDESGKVSGFWADITNYIAEKEGWEIEWVQGTWDECLERLEKNEIDIMVDVGYNSDRALRFFFSKETALQSWSRLYVNENFTFNSIEDLKGKKVAVLKNSVNYIGPEGLKTLLERFELNCEFVEFESYDDVFKAVSEGFVQAGATNKYFGEQNEKKYRIKRTSLDFQPAKLLFAFPFNSVKVKKLLPVIDTHLINLKGGDGNSFYYRTLDKWYGSAEGKRTYIPVWVYWGLALLLSAVIAMFIVNKILSKIVASKTKELELAYAGLETKVKERTRELWEANEKLKEMDRLKSVFIASMSHELRTPLNSIIGFTGLILQGISGKIDDAAKEDLEIVYNSSKHLLSLINDVIDISKIEADKIDVYYEEFAVADVIEEVVTTVSKDADKKNLSVKVNMPSGLIIKSDRKRLFQCVLNLVGNAVKYSEKGTVEVRAEKKIDKLTITVSDTGIGIRQEDIPKLFNSFIRLESHIKDATLGTGLGLYLTKKIVTGVLNGKIGLESRIGEGSIFTIEIPLKTEA